MYTSRKSKLDISYIFLGKVAAIFIFMIILFLFVVFALPERTASAGNSAAKAYTITSVQIEEGDSLWSLASKYYSEEFMSVTNYIAEIKRMNGITSDVLYAGNYILIPHFVAE